MSAIWTGPSWDGLSLLHAALTEMALLELRVGGGGGGGRGPLPRWLTHMAGKLETAVIF